MIIADVEVVTEVVVTVKVALVAPAGTAILTGTVADVELHDSETDPPPVGAGALKVTVPVAEAPPTTLVGLNDTVERTGPGGGGGGGGGAGGAVTDRPARANVPSVAVMMANTPGAPTGLVVTVKVALVRPAGTVTLGGTVATAESLKSVTTDPPATAGKSSITVPVEGLPPTTLLGVRKRLEIDGGLKNSGPLTVAPS